MPRRDLGHGKRSRQELVEELGPWGNRSGAAIPSKEKTSCVLFSFPQKAKVDAIILWGVNRAVKFTLGDVLGDVAHQVVEAGYGEKVAEFAQAAVVRGVEIGYDKAMEEVREG